jgi:hypothetical protein
MSRIVIIRLIVILIAAVLLLWGIRTDDSTIRLAGIACLVVALALRFVKPRGR